MSPCKAISFLLMIGLHFFSTNSYSQDTIIDFKPSGRLKSTIYFNYKYDFNNNMSQSSSFNLDRAYLGYTYDFSSKVSGRVVYDIGYDGKQFSAYAKNAQLDWKILPTFQITAGMFGTKHFDTQERFWGYRYLMKPFSDEQKMISSADLGINFEIKPLDFIQINFFVQNGEGYKSLQDNFGMHKFGSSIVLTNISGLIFKGYYDIMPNQYRTADSLPIKDTCVSSSFVFFAGYEKKDKFRIGAEYNSLLNAKEFNKYAENYSLSGISIYSAYCINKKIEIFSRFDLIQSNKLNGLSEAWNSKKDGYMFLGGVQYKAAKGVHIGLNYRTWIFQESSTKPLSCAYLNFGLFF